MKTLLVKDTYAIGEQQPFTLIAGPCVIENRYDTLRIARHLIEVCEPLGVQLIFKASYDKANRTSVGGARGVGIQEGLAILHEVKSRFRVMVTTDVHEIVDCPQVAEVVDVLQIPAFLCRQTDLLAAAARAAERYKAIINIKKGQFLAPRDMQHAVNKVRLSGCPDVLVTERGTSFGYNTLVNDFRGLHVMRDSCDAPVIFDATHSVQEPGGKGGSSGGNRDYVPMLARAAVAVGVAGLFVECHPDPDSAPSDGPNMLHLRDIEPLLRDLLPIREIAQHRRLA